MDPPHRIIPSGNKTVGQRKQPGPSPHLRASLWWADARSPPSATEDHLQRMLVNPRKNTPSSSKESESPSLRPIVNKVLMCRTLISYSPDPFTTRPLKPPEGRVWKLQEMASYHMEHTAFIICKPHGISLGFPATLGTWLTYICLNWKDGEKKKKGS